MSCQFIAEQFQHGKITTVNIIVRVKVAFRDGNEWLIAKAFKERHGRMPINKSLLSEFTINSSLKQFTAYRLHFADPSFSALMFENGSIMIVGLKDRDKIIDCVDTSLKNLADAINTDIMIGRVSIVNIVTSFNLFPIDFKSLQEYLRANNKAFIYNPLTFPGLFLRINVPNYIIKRRSIQKFYESSKAGGCRDFRPIKVLIFQQGKTVMLGTQGEQDWIIAFEMLFALLINFTTSQGNASLDMTIDQRTELQKKYKFPRLGWFRKNKHFLLSNNDGGADDIYWEDMERGINQSNRENQEYKQHDEVPSRVLTKRDEHLSRFRSNITRRAGPSSLFKHNNNVNLFIRPRADAASKPMESIVANDDDEYTLSLFNWNISPRKCKVLRDLFKPNVADLTMIFCMPPPHVEGVVDCYSWTPCQICQVSGAVSRYQLRRWGNQLELLNRFKPTGNREELKLRDIMYKELYESSEMVISSGKWILMKCDVNDEEVEQTPSIGLTSQFDILNLIPEWFIDRMDVTKMARNGNDYNNLSSCQKKVNSRYLINHNALNLDPVFPSYYTFFLRFKNNPQQMCKTCESRWIEFKPQRLVIPFKSGRLIKPSHWGGNNNTTTNNNTKAKTEEELYTNTRRVKTRPIIVTSRRRALSLEPLNSRRTTPPVKCLITDKSKIAFSSEEEEEEENKEDSDDGSIILGLVDEADFANYSHARATKNVLKIFYNHISLAMTDDYRLEDIATMFDTSTAKVISNSRQQYMTRNLLNDRKNAGACVSGKTPAALMWGVKSETAIEYSDNMISSTIKVREPPREENGKLVYSGSVTFDPEMFASMDFRKKHKLQNYRNRHRKHSNSLISNTNIPEYAAYHYMNDMTEKRKLKRITKKRERGSTSMPIAKGKRRRRSLISKAIKMFSTLNPMDGIMCLEQMHTRKKMCCECSNSHWLKLSKKEEEKEEEGI